MTKINTNKKTSKFLTLFITILCFGLCFSFAELFSSLITVGGFNVIKNNAVTQTQFSLYAISLYSCDTKVQAKEMSEVTKRKGGAGYIWQTTQKYYILASCYENKTDAEKVCENLKSNSVSCEMITMEFDSMVISCTVVDQEKNALEASVLSYKNLFKKLYDLSVSIDTNLYTEIQAKMYLSDIVSEFTKTKSNFETLFNSKLTSELLELKLSLANLNNILQSLAEFSSSEVPYTSQVKNTYFQVLDEYKNISKSL